MIIALLLVSGTVNGQFYHHFALLNVCALVATDFNFLGCLLGTGVMTLLSISFSYIAIYIITGRKTLKSSNPSLREALG